jgi:hypothetical protein
MQERLGHVTKAQKNGVSSVPMVGEVKAPGLPKKVHPVARRWYNALKQSGQTAYFEPSDWAAALYVAEAMTKNLEDSRFSAQLFGAVWTAMDDLLSTESARRRVRIEVQRQIASVDPTAESEFEKYKRSVGR